MNLFILKRNTTELPLDRSTMCLTSEDLGINEQYRRMNGFQRLIDKWSDIQYFQPLGFYVCICSLNMTKFHKGPPPLVVFIPYVNESVSLILLERF